MTTRKLTQIAKRVYKHFKINEQVLVRELRRGAPWFNTVYGLHTVRPNGSRIMWIRLYDRFGKRYKPRTLLSNLAHELAHIVSSTHGKRFRWMHRTFSRAIKRLYA